MFLAALHYINLVKAFECEGEGCGCDSKTRAIQFERREGLLAFESLVSPSFSEFCLTVAHFDGQGPISSSARDKVKKRVESLTSNNQTKAVSA